MSELRKDPISGRSVIIAEDRSRRPNDFTAAPTSATQGECPFCPGNERNTPHEIIASRDEGLPADDPNWRVRVVPNKFPAVAAAGLPSSTTGGLYDMLAGSGVHEVIIESARHIRSTSQLSVTEIAEVFTVYRQRLLALRDDPRLAHAMIFKNVGPAAGASLEHIHSQLIALPTVPIFLRDELAGSQAFFSSEQRCIFCEMISQEQAGRRRMVLETAEFVAFCPYAARFPYETWILPKTHESRFESITDLQAPDLAHIIKQVIARIEACLRQSAYNYIIHSAPFDTRPLEHYHWHIEIVPRSTTLAGFELGTGFHINPLPPETAAEQMRVVDVSDGQPDCV